MSPSKHLIQKVRAELGEEWNPVYVEKLLIQGIPELLEWLHQALQGSMPAAAEMIQIAHKNQESEREERKKTLLLGLKILEGHMQLYAFVCRELKSRVEAIELQTKESQ